MHQINTAAVLANICDQAFDSDPEMLTGSLAHLADRLSWLNDDEANTFEDYPGIGWEDPAFEPTPADWAAYRNPEDTDNFLGDDERSLLIHTTDEWSFRAESAALAKALESGRHWL